jgi:hypothetical protein
MDLAVSEDEDEQLRLAIAMSLQDQAKQNSDQAWESEKTFLDLLDQNERQASQKHLVPSKDTTNSSFGILGLDRATMEAERLARAGKRKASISPPPLSRPAKTSKATEQRVSASSAQTTVGLAVRSLPASKKAHVNGIQYPEGVVKKTWSFGFPREDDIKLEEVLQRSTLHIAVLSSFQWDIEWLFRKLDMARSKVLLVMQAKDNATKEQYAQETSDMPNLRLCFPSMAGNVNCMHSKLMLLSHDTHLRVVVPTANLVPYDWGEQGVLENSVFLIDLPRLPDDAPAQDEANLTFFGQELFYFCRAMDLSPRHIRSMLRFDFSATKRYAFVHTIGGEHAGSAESWRRTGYPGLGRAVTKLGLQSSSDLEVDFIASSLGSLNMDFFSMLYLAAQGDDGTTEFKWRTITKSKANAKLIDQNRMRQDKLVETIEDRVRVFFPSRDTILESIGGVDAGGPICFQRRWWEGPKFPRKVLRDCKSTRKGLLMHNKILYVRPQDVEHAEREDTPSSDASTIDPDEPEPAPTSAPGPRPWAYVGSANCSESAWGRLVLEKNTKIPKLGCRNWECGVIVPVEDVPVYTGVEKPSGLEVFKGTLPVPIEWPSERMEGKTPWFFTAD